MNNIQHTDYDKLTDDVLLLGYNIILRFNVILSKQLKDGTRYHYHHEYKYNTNKYINKKSLITLRRSFDYFLTIENIKPLINNKKEYVMITIQDILYVREQLNKAVQWFRKGDLFGYDKNNNKLAMLGTPKSIYINNLPMDKYIILDPIIIKYENTDITGIRFSLNNKENYIDIPLDRFMGLVYIINEINMYQSAQLLLNYLQRPEFGQNIHNFQYGSDIYEDKEGYVETNTKRKIKNKKSFFDKMDEL